MLHILIGQDEYLSQVLGATPETKIRWVVPKRARPGDIALLYFPSASELKARAEVGSSPVRDSFGDRLVYAADIRSITRLTAPIPLGQLAERFPDWKWPTYPRSYTTVDDSLREPLLALCGASAHDDNDAADLPDVDISALEGDPRLRVHLRYERSASLASAKREAVLQELGRLECEACGFAPGSAYRDLDIETCEVHHRKPLHELAEPTRVETRVSDLALLCPNCHRAIHRTKPMMTVEQFRQHVASAKQ